MATLTASEVQHILHQAMPSAADAGIKILHTDDGLAQIVLPFRDWMLRPGGTLSGPAMMTAADVAMYALILSAYGPELLAVTSDLNMRFLAKPQAKDLVATARFLKAGRRLLVMSVDVCNRNAPDALLAQVTGSYVRPGERLGK